MLHSLPCCEVVMDRVGGFFRCGIDHVHDIPGARNCFLFRGQGVGGFMWAASGIKSIKDGEPGPWTGACGQGYCQQLAGREGLQTFSKNRLNLFALSFIQSTPYRSDCLISCYYPQTSPDLPCLSFRRPHVLLPWKLSGEAWPDLCLSHQDNLNVLRNPWLVFGEAIDFLFWDAFQISWCSICNCMLFPKDLLTPVTPEPRSPGKLTNPRLIASWQTEWARSSPNTGSRRRATVVTLY